jgi:hypothetical protein
LSYCPQSDFRAGKSYFSKALSNFEALLLLEIFAKMEAILK